MSTTPFFPSQSKVRTLGTQSHGHSYVLGHSERELDRLSLQGRMFAPFTQQVFREAGLAPGMHVLDVGCGSGDVAFLAAEFVGPRGSVVGVDRAPAAVERAKHRAQKLGIANVEFVEGDPVLMRGEEGFDAMVGRLILMYYHDPVDALRKLLGHLRPGGVVAFQEGDLTSCKSLPLSPTYEGCIDWIIQTLKRSGARTQLGLELHQIFLSAGLPPPSLRLDASVGAGPESPAYELVAEVARSLLPAMEKFDVATPAEVRVDTLADRLREEVTAGGGVVVAPSLIGAWTRKAT
jgi:SAM-dependent methyltransferase